MTDHHHNREEVVDAAVVARTQNRRDYVQSLLAFADAPALVPASAFVGSSQLSNRLRRLTEEVRMSPMRLRLTISTLAAVFVAAVGLAGVGLRYDLIAQQPIAVAPPGSTSSWRVR